MKRTIITALVLLACFACTKKSATNSSTPGNTSSGQMTESKTDPSASIAANSPRELSGAWIVTQPGQTWELVLTKTAPNTFAGSSTLVETDNPKGLYGPVGSKGDDIVIVTDAPGKFRVRWAKAEDYHGTEFWQGTGTYDDNNFDFAGFYKGKRKS